MSETGFYSDCRKEEGAICFDFFHSVFHFFTSQKHSSHALCFLVFTFPLILSPFFNKFIVSFLKWQNNSKAIFFTIAQRPESQSFSSNFALNRGEN
jgi:hypothetical protein